MPSTSSHQHHSVHLVPAQYPPRPAEIGRREAPETLLRHRHVLVVAADYAPEQSEIAVHTTALVDHLALTAASVTVITSAGAVSTDAAPRRRRLREPRPGRRRSTMMPRFGPLVLRVPRGRHRDHMAYRAGDELGFLSAALGTGLPRIPDLVVAVTPGLGGALAAARIARRHGAPLIVVAHDLIGAHQGAPLGHPLRVAAAAERRLLRAADEVAVVSGLLDEVVARAGVATEHVHLLPLWMSDRTTGLDPAAARQALGWPVEPFTVVHAGFMGTRQDLGTVIEASRHLADHAQIVLVGDGPRRISLQTQATHVDGVTFVGTLDDVRHRFALAAADLLLINEHPDAGGPRLSGKLTAYLGAGRPVLAAVRDTSAVAGLLQQTDGAGLVVRPGDPRLLAAAVRALSLDDDLRAAMSRAALHYARTGLDHPAAMHRLDAIIEAAFTRP